MRRRLLSWQSIMHSMSWNCIGIEAGVMPHNKASIRVLEKAGFHKEGIARKNVKINGKWEDHQVLAIIHPEDT
ncbi:RimJ/RimL family protein N-acetyltransferase [Bacillus velezensis]|nr:RimJ/RimL family protein N-acetyltransferase [Bacillus velezensis]MDF9782371.1 RimJ/RimL family protein N-acetyltransferase [Bacillus velezensis]